MRWVRACAAACRLAILGLLVWGSIAVAQSQENKFPARAIEVIVPWGAGGGADQLARLLSKRGELALTVPFPVSNYPGASGTIGIQRLLNAPADGHALAILTGDSLSARANGVGNWKLEDLAPLGVFVRQQSGLFVRFDSRYRTWADVIADQKTGANVTVATTGPGSMDDMTVRHLQMKGVSLLSVPYPKPAERYAAVIGNHVELLYEQAGDIKGHLDAKVLRPLIFFAQRRNTAFPDVPASAEFRYELALTQFRAVVAKTGTDAGRLSILESTIGRYARSDEFTAYLRDQLADVDSYIPASQAQAFLRSEFAAMQKFVVETTGRSQ